MSIERPMKKAARKKKTRLPKGLDLLAPVEASPSLRQIADAVLSEASIVPEEDIYLSRDERALLVCGDALEVIARVGRRLEVEKLFDIVVTSPPYNLLGRARKRRTRIESEVGISAEGLSSKGLSTKPSVVEWGARVSAEVSDWDNFASEEFYQSWLREAVGLFLEQSRGIVWINHRVRYLDGVASHPLEILAGFPLHGEVVLSRGGSLAQGANRFAPSHEGLYAFGSPHWWDKSINHLFTVWEYSQTRIEGHPCPFPETIPARVIRASCPVGGVVCDPFAGSGQSGMAALKLGRLFFGVEKKRSYFDLAKRRIEALCGELHSEIVDSIPGIS